MILRCTKTDTYHSLWSSWTFRDPVLFHKHFDSVTYNSHINSIIASFKDKKRIPYRLWIIHHNLSFIWFIEIDSRSLFSISIASFAECSISQNSASVIFRVFLKFASNICPMYLNYASIKWICPSVIFRGYQNSALVILIYPWDYRGFRPLCYTLVCLSISDMLRRDSVYP